MPPKTPLAQDPKDTNIIQRLAALLGLGPDATEEDVMALLARKLPAAKEATPDPRKFVPVEAVAELLEDRNGRIALMNEQTAAAMVQKAFDEGYLTPAMRGWATALASQDPDSFKAFLGTAPRPFSHLLTPMQRPLSPVAAQDDDSDEAAAICAQLGLRPGSLNF